MQTRFIREAMVELRPAIYLPIALASCPQDHKTIVWQARPPMGDVRQLMLVPVPPGSKVQNTRNSLDRWCPDGKDARFPWIGLARICRIDVLPTCSMQHLYSIEVNLKV